MQNPESVLLSLMSEENDRTVTDHSERYVRLIEKLFFVPIRKKLIQEMCGSNRIAPRLTRCELQCIFCGNTSSNGLSLLGARFSPLELFSVGLPYNFVLHKFSKETNQPIFEFFCKFILICYSSFWFTQLLYIFYS